MDEILKSVTDSTRAYGYNISNKPILEKHITPEIQDELERVYFTLNKKTKNLSKLIADIKQLAWKYPDVVQFKNYLQIAYYQNKQIQLGDELTEKILEQHPDYIFARLNKAASCILKKDYNNFLLAIKDANDVQDLAPDRDTFHVSEVLGFHKLYVLYACGIENLELAESRFEIMEEIDRKSGETKIAWDALLQLRLKKMDEQMKKSDELSAKYAEVEPNFLSLEQTNERPVFNHQQVWYLYEVDEEIDTTKFDAILNLPRETLIQDLVEILKDSITRFHYHDSNDQVSWFCFHSLAMLKELNAKEALPAILEILKQGEEYHDFYFGDLITEELWEVFYQLFDLQILIDFLQEPNIYSFAKCPVLKAVEQLLLTSKIEKNEGFSFYNDVLNFYLKNNHDKNHLDIKTISHLVGDICTLRLIEFVPLIKQLYAQDLIDEFLIGSEGNILEEIYTPLKQNSIRQFHPGYSTWYKDLCSYYKNDDDFDDDLIPFDETHPTILPKLNTNLQNPLDSNLSIGRNELCPCGSGKKFKKCCLE